MKITKAMLERAEKEHLRKEDDPSLVKLHALSSLYYSQRGEKKKAKEFITGEDVHRKILQLATKKKVKKKMAKKKMMQKKSYAVGSAEWVKRETGI